MTAFKLLEIGGIAGALITLISLGGWLLKNLTKQIRRIAAPIQSELAEAVAQNREAVKMSLKYAITRAHEEYTQKGKIGRYALQCIHEMQEKYKELGGNGFIETLVNQLYQLPPDMSVALADTEPEVSRR